MRTRTLVVPQEMALVLDRDGWRLRQVPPRWWIDALDPEIADEPQAQPQPAQPPTALNARQTSCRPGYGPCRRRHEHTSRRRSAA